MDNLPEFIGNHTLLVVALMISFFVLVFTELRRKASGMVNIGASEAVSLINNDATVVDLRNAEAYARGHIVNSKNIPFDEFAARKDTLSTSTPVVTVCDSAKESCPALPQAKETLHWPFPDPADATGSDEERIAMFREVRDMIKSRIQQFLAEQER